MIGFIIVEATLSHIKTLIEQNHLQEALLDIDAYIKTTPEDDMAYYLKGNIYRKLDDWKNALTNYSAAREINPSGPGAQAYDATIEVLNFYHTDLYNP